MADKDEFSFEEEGELRGGGEDSGAYAEEYLRESLSASAIKKEKKGSPKRPLLLVLLLVVIGAAGWFFFLGAPEAPPPAPLVVVKKRPIAVPAPPAPVKEEMPEVPAPPQAQEAPVEKPVVLEVMPTEKPAPVEVSSQSSEEAPALAAPPGAYSVEAGAFLLKSNLAEAEKKVRELGFEPLVVQKEKSVTMTRLRIGVFSPEEGKRKVEELTTLAPDAFYVRQGDEVAVYAASFYDLDTARRFADRLYEQGIRVVEMPVQTGIPMFLLSFGDFADLPAAREASEKAQAAGLEVFVVKNR